MSHKAISAASWIPAAKSHLPRPTPPGAAHYLSTEQVASHKAISAVLWTPPPACDAITANAAVDDIRTNLAIELIIAFISVKGW